VTGFRHYAETSIVTLSHAKREGERAPSRLIAAGPYAPGMAAGRAQIRGVLCAYGATRLQLLGGGAPEAVPGARRSREKRA
jgi:hypothetical protein